MDQQFIYLAKHMWETATLPVSIVFFVCFGYLIAWLPGAWICQQDIDKGNI